MNNSVIEAQAHYLIEDRIHPAPHRRQAPSGVRRRARKVRKLSWL